MKAPQVHLYVGTRKGGFLLTSDAKRKSWRVTGPFFAGWEVHHLTRDPRSGKIWAALNTSWWGSDVQVSANGGKTWRKAAAGIGFAKDRGLNLERIWRIVPDRAARPDTLWCGAAPGVLFRTDDHGKNWSEVRSLTDHPTRQQHWMPGAGGLMVHHILPDPSNLQRISVAISAAGFFRSQDDGVSWTALNKGVRVDFKPDKFPVAGQCVHSMRMSAANPEWLFQQNHCGVYRTRNAGESWTDISRGLPSRFGFAMAIHPHEAETVYVFPEYSAQNRVVCDGRLGVYRSRDGGRTWQLLTRGLPQKHVYTQVLRHASASDTCERAGIYFGATSGEIYGSPNGGDTWSVIAANLPPVISLEAFVV
jgi:photosystem II stability/assembly factor-like uncharacterized protein